MRSLECTLATTTSSCPSSSSVWSSEPSSRMSTSIPDRIRNGARSDVQLIDQRELGTETVDGQPAGHGEPGRVVGRARATRARGPARPAPSPAAGSRRRTSRSARGSRPASLARSAVRRSRRPAAEQPGQVLRLLPGYRLRDHLGGHLTDPGELPQRPGPHPVGQLARAQPGGDLGGAPERPDPVRRRAGPLKLEGDLPQRPRRVHISQVTRCVVQSADLSLG